MNIREAVRGHYCQRWGDPQREAIFSFNDSSIEVLKWDEGATGEGVTLYATVGASEASSAHGAASHRSEYVLGLNPSRDDVVRALAGLGLYEAISRTRIQHGDTVPSDGPLWPGTAMNAFLVVRPRSELLPVVVLGGAHVEFLQAIPLFSSERAYKSAHGVTALLKLWESDLVPFWDPARDAGV